jgi:hypothetical protein
MRRMQRFACCCGAVLALAASVKVAAQEAGGPSDTEAEELADSADPDERERLGRPVRRGDLVWDIGVALFPGYDSNPRYAQDESSERASSSLFGAQLFVGVRTPLPSWLALDAKTALSIQQLEGSDGSGVSAALGDPETALLGRGLLSAVIRTDGILGLRLQLEGDRTSVLPRSVGIPVPGHVEILEYDGTHDAILWPGRYEERRTVGAAYAGLAVQGGEDSYEADLGLRVRSTSWDDAEHMNREEVVAEARGRLRLGSSYALRADGEWGNSRYPNIVPRESVFIGETNFEIPGQADLSSNPRRARVGLDATPAEAWSFLAVAGWGQSFHTERRSEVGGPIGHLAVQWEPADGTSVRLGYQRDFDDLSLEGVTRDELRFRFRVVHPHELVFVSEARVTRVAFAPLDDAYLPDVSVDGVRGTSPYSTLNRVDLILSARSRVELHLSDIVTAGVQHDYVEGISDFVVITGGGSTGTWHPEFDRHRLLVTLSLHSRP